MNDYNYNNNEWNGQEQNLENRQNPDVAKGQTEQSTGSAAGSGGVTYSWVNPKVQQRAEQTQQGAGQTWQSAGQTWQSAGQTQQGAGQTWQSAGQTQQSAGRTQQTSYPWEANASAPRRKTKKRRGWGTVVAMALVFGLIAGGLTYGVNFAANRIHPVSTATTAESTAIPALQIASTNAETTSEATRTSAAGSTKTVAEVTADVMPAMVTISTMSVQEMQSFFGGSQKYEVPGAGTGFIISQTEDELLIATNNHVISSATQVSVGFVDEAVAEASVKGQDAAADVAVLAVKMSDISEETRGEIKVAALGNSDELVLGEQVVAIGNALGYGQSVTSGYISGFNRELKLTDGKTSFTATGLIQTDAAINSGNSGGALVNMNGEVIGINEAKSSMTSSGATVDNVGYVIPMAKALPILQELMSQETKEILPEEKQGYLGVSCADVTEDYASMYDMPQGVCFTSVGAGGPAAAAGVKKGDVLVKFDGRSITDFSSLTNVMKYYASGETVEIVVMRANEGEYKEVTLTVTLGDQTVIQGVGAEDDN